MLESLVNGRYLLSRDWRAEIRDQDLERWLATLEKLPLGIEVETCRWNRVSCFQSSTQGTGKSFRSG